MHVLSCFIYSDAKQPHGHTYWNGNSKLPVYSNEKECMSTEAATKIILDENFDESMVCQMQPTCVDKNTVFVVDLKQLSNPKDINCDDMGSWRANGTHRSDLLVNTKGNIVILSQRKVDKSRQRWQYKLVKRYYYHKTATDLHKTTYIMEGTVGIYIVSCKLVQLSLYCITCVCMG